MSAPFDRRLTAARDDLAAEHLRGRLERPRYAAPEPMQVTAPVADLRLRPADDAPLDTQLFHGERLGVLEIRDGWAWGQSETDGYVGYVRAGALGPPGPPATHRVATRAAHVYPGPDIKLPPRTRLPGPAQVATARERDGFAALADGGFVPLGQLAPLDTPVADWVAGAEALLASPYLWGGRSADGLDCSALVQLSLAAAGHAAPRDSDMQEAGLGTPLAADTPLRRGDLVFWTGHVAILRDAETIVHANAHHMAVAIEPLAEATARIRAAGGGGITLRKRLDLKATSA